MTTTIPLDEWEAERKRLLARIAALGDLRPGSLTATYVTCGKSNCRCAEHRHGPHRLLTYTVAGKTRSRSIPAAELEATRGQIAECQRLRDLVAQLIAVSTDLCQGRTRSAKRRAAASSTSKSALSTGSAPRKRSNSAASASANSVVQAFFPASAASWRTAWTLASQTCSLTAISSATNWRRRWHSAIWAWVCAKAWGGMARVRVLPSTLLVRIQRGPWPRAPA